MTQWTPTNSESLQWHSKSSKFGPYNFDASSFNVTAYNMEAQKCNGSEEMKPNCTVNDDANRKSGLQPSSTTSIWVAASECYSLPPFCHFVNDFSTVGVLNWFAAEPPQDLHLFAGWPRVCWLLFSQKNTLSGLDHGFGCIFRNCTKTVNQPRPFFGARPAGWYTLWQIYYSYWFLTIHKKIIKNWYKDNYYIFYK